MAMPWNHYLLKNVEDIVDFVVTFVKKKHNWKYLVFKIINIAI